MIHFHTNIGSFEEANRLAEKGCNQSDLSDINDLKTKRKLKVKKNNQSYSDCLEYSGYYLFTLPDNNLSSVYILIYMTYL